MLPPAEQITEFFSQKFLYFIISQQYINTAVSICLGRVQMFRGALEINILNNKGERDVNTVLKQIYWNNLECIQLSLKAYKPLMNGFPSKFMLNLRVIIYLRL